MGSRIVEIRRKNHFNNDQKKEYEQYSRDFHRSVGAYWKKGSNRSGSGLSFEEEDLLMPEVLDVDAKDREFRKKVAAYFDAIDTDVPHAGKKLEAGLLNNDKPLAADNMPIEPEQYIRWRHATSHPQMAENKLAADRDQTKFFYFFSGEDEMDDQYELTKIKDAAMAEYLSSKGDIKKVIMVLELLAVPKVGEMTDKARLVAFKQEAEKQPVLFHKYCIDKDLKDKYTINLLVSAGVLQKTNAGIPEYLSEESGKPLAKGIKAMVAWWNNPENSKDVQIFKAQYRAKTTKASVEDEE